jgi:hypothetical protein
MLTNCSSFLCNQQVDPTDEGDLLDYTKEENYKVDCFVGHDMGYHVQQNGKTKKKREMLLRTRWKGFGPEHDTYEPINEKADDECQMVLDYIKNHGDAFLRTYIWKNKQRFPKSFISRFDTQFMV